MEYVNFVFYFFGHPPEKDIKPDSVIHIHKFEYGKRLKNAFSIKS